MTRYLTDRPPAFRAAFFGMSLAVIAVLSYLDSALAVFAAPGARFGLANIVVVIYIYAFKNFWYPLAAVFSKIVISAIFSANWLALLFTFAGSLAAFLIMLAAKKLSRGKIGVTGVSVLGGSAHIAAQFAVSAWVLSSGAVWAVYPLSAAVSLIAAVFTGTASYLVLERMRLL